MMQGNVLQQIETDDVVFFEENRYNRADRDKYLTTFQKMVADGQLEGNFEDIRWMGYSGIKKFRIDFAMDEHSYVTHFGKEFRILYSTMQEMLRCYALYIVGAYIFPTINERISWIKQFMIELGNSKLVLPADAEEVIQDFLCYIGTPAQMINELIQRIHFEKAPKSQPRELAHLINYLAVANEINDMYQGSLTDEDYKKWFPIFFWTNVTFVLPLRATEMLVTPFACITHINGKTYITLRRTQLKGKRQTVYYNVELDYKEFRYEIPNNWVVEVIENYQEITSDHTRKYLFDYTKYMINDMVSLESFNLLLAEFISTYLIGNKKYDYAKYATGINEFEIITAGDSRPIAMANLYFQDISADICRQLADHSQISTSFGYYTNVSNTIQCASIMKIQQRIIRKKFDLEDAGAAHAMKLIHTISGVEESLCLSPMQPMVTGNISDCIKEKHLHECMGCKYYSPTEAELKKELEARKQKLDAASKQLIEYIADTRIGGKEKVDIDRLFLDTHTGATRFKLICNQYAEVTEYRWQRQRSIQKKNC